MTVCFTGHRPQSFSFGFNEMHPTCIDIKKRLREEIEKLAENGATTFLCGMAQGVDTWAAEAVLAVQKEKPHISLVAVIPCPEQTKSWSRKSVERYEHILRHCSERIVTSPSYFRGCMHVRNKYMVDQADVVVAVFNGTESGGTASTVSYAKRSGKCVICLIPQEDLRKKTE